ncbi:protein BOLA4, chloroplastic/mitochondrial-like [Gossypium australe]|uniref:Protein BOLA4, chloroplastic/mitochondrial-like n=1 Tax=Gossypium australe TaxID=47621 RepID=A0A5B6X0B4_9ROSI|nr:protein BOLA4, chloroplastic/mitochondrial-like [Gossypium australe]
MAKTLITTRPFFFSSIKASLFLKSFPLFSQSNNISFCSHPTLLPIKNHPDSSFFGSSNINKSTNNVEKKNRYVSRTSSGILGHRGFSIKATHVNDPGSIDSPLIQSMEKKIKEHLNAESVIVQDASGDGRHFAISWAESIFLYRSIDVIASAFDGQSVVNRQRMVYKAIWEELQNTVHAVDQMTTKTPSEAAASQK